MTPITQYDFSTNNNSFLPNINTNNNLFALNTNCYGSEAQLQDSLWTQNTNSLPFLQNNFSSTNIFSTPSFLDQNDQIGGLIPNFLSPFPSKNSLNFFQNFDNYYTTNFTSPNAAVNKALSQVGHKGGQSYGAGNQAWCAAFASWAYGGKSAPWGQQLSVAGIKNWAVNNNKYKSGKSFDGVKAGDLVVWRPDTSGRSHVGIVASVENGKIKTVEGNTSGDLVNTRTYAAGTNFDGFVSV